MVSKITIFEPHFDGAQFGPESMELPDSAESEQTTGFFSRGGADDEDGGDGEDDDAKSGLVTLLQGLGVFVVMFTVLWLVLSRRGSDDENGDETS